MTSKQTIKFLDQPVARIGFGCCPMGEHGWGTVRQEELEQAVIAALDAGISLFDTADVYGLGTSERTLGRILSHSQRRHEAIVATKVGVRFVGKKTFYDNSATWINQAVDASLKRLNMEQIDLYQLHYWDGVTPLAKIISVFQELIRRGKIRAFGLTNINPADHGIKTDEAGFSSYSYEYSLGKRMHEDVIRDINEKYQLPFFSWGSLGQGILSGRYSEGSVEKGDRRERLAYTNFHGERCRNNLRIVELLKEISSRLDTTPVSVAIRWVLDQLPNAVCLVGIKRPDQVIDIARALSLKLGSIDHDSLARLSNANIRSDPPMVRPSMSSERATS